MHVWESMATHVIKQGEHLSRVAASYGIRDPQVIWNHPENASLKRLRKSPDVLMPGDRLFVPDRQSRQENQATGSRVTFKVSQQIPKLRLVLQEFGGSALKNTELKLQVEGIVHELVTDDSGAIEVPIPPQAGRARLLLGDAAAPSSDPVLIKIGHLDPVDVASGQRARLTNLGYFIDPADHESESEAFRSAVEEFQCDSGLTVDGICGPKTQAKLEKVHGC
jgi:Putative peptidoglycan binding domain